MSAHCGGTLLATLRLIINDCLDSGSQLPFIRRATEVHTYIYTYINAIDVNSVDSEGGNASNSGLGLMFVQCSLSCFAAEWLWRSGNEHQ